MNKNTKYVIIALLSSIMIINAANYAYAHKALTIKDIEIEVGWLSEPPLVGELNAITLEFKKDSKPFVIEPTELSVSVRYGGVSKTLEIEPLAEPGKYASPIIPTRTGSYVVVLKGSVGGNTVNAEVPIEDVEDKARIAFPDESDTTDAQRIIPTLQSSLIQLQNKAERALSEAEDAKKTVEEIKSSIDRLNNDSDNAYKFGLMGLSVGIAGVAVGIGTMVKYRNRL
jgi:hypothetical protein